MKKNNENSEMSEAEVFQEEILQKRKKIEDELKLLDEWALQQTGMNQKDLENFFNNPNNFEADLWKTFQERKKKIEHDIFSTLSKEDKKELEQALASKSQKKRKGQKKNWLQM